MLAKHIHVFMHTHQKYSVVTSSTNQGRNSTYLKKYMCICESEGMYVYPATAFHLPIENNRHLEYYWPIGVLDPLKYNKSEEIIYYGLL